jgi:hypothetical protein
MPDISKVVDAYFAAWNEADEEKRVSLLADAYSDSGASYVDPVSHVAGIPAINQMIAGFHAQYAGASLRRTSEVDQHHNSVRFNWDIKQADGSQLVAGVDYGTLAPDGRLESITGFFGATIPDLVPA